MSKKAYYINNITKKPLDFPEFDLTIQPGIYNLYALNPNITYEVIDYSLKFGKLKSYMEAGLCRFVPETNNPYLNIGSKNIVYKQRAEDLTVFPSRTRFNIQTLETKTVFNSPEDFNLFEDEEVKSAREIEDELKKSTANIEQIEATIKKADIQEKPINPEIIKPTIKKVSIAQKIRNDKEMGYKTCNAFTKKGKRCVREVIKNSNYCSLHQKRAPKKQDG